jgi:hypothetical protein
MSRSAPRLSPLAEPPAGERAVRFESLDADSPFAAEVVFDDDGFVLDYPGIALRI